MQHDITSHAENSEKLKTMYAKKKQRSRMILQKIQKV